MLVIRMLRIGKKNQPSFKIVIVDKRRPPKSGKFVEEVGFWNPLTKEKVLRKERIQYWISKGVKLSESVHNLLVREEILEGKKIPKHKKPKVKKEEISPKEEAPKKEEKTKPESKVKKQEEVPVSQKEEPKKETQEIREEKPEETKEVKEGKSEGNKEGESLDKNLKKE